MDIAFLITTYNRQESCQRLVDALQGLGDIIVLNDGCNYDITGATQFKQSHHGGRDGYWNTVNQLFKIRGYHRYYFMLPDDFLMCDLQIKDAINIWEGIDDPRKMCLNLYTDRIGISCWTHFVPIDKGNVWQTGWVDMCFMCEGSFFRTIGTIPKLSAHMSSGVGAYISRKLHKLRYGMYQVKESLVTLQAEHYTSQMHQRIKILQHETNRRNIYIKDTRKRI